ncbi:MAG: ATP-binding protein [Christensenellaceae bacterium]|jgi:hypothetical protein|nr:ATP-binding protein [Christensenellaceae bacterium]
MAKLKELLGRITVLCGNYGSGKTEISLNLALGLAREGEKVSFVDLDIVNPYFRSSSRAELLRAEGIEVLMPNFALSSVDVPSLPAQIQSIFVDKSRRVIIDVGGDDTGSAALGQYKPHFDADDVRLLYVVNVFRPLSADAEAILDLMARIEAKGRLRVSGLINNANLASETQSVQLARGDEILREVSAKKGVPIAFLAGKEGILAGAEPALLGERLPIEIRMRPEWLD